MIVSHHTAPHQCLPIFEFTVASQQPEFIEFRHVELAVFQLIKIFLDDYRVGCVDELMNIPRYQRQIGIVVLSATGFWHDVVDFHIPQQQGFFTNGTFSALSDIKGNAVVVQLGTLPLYGMLHELLQDDRVDCLLQLMDFSPSLFRVIANIRGEAHGRRGLHSVDWKERQPSHIEYFPGKITIELLKCLTSQAGLTAMAFRSA